MKRVTSLPLVLALLLCAGCSSTDVQVPPAGLAETYDLVLANDLIFVTSAETDDLKIIDPVATDYVRAPNPLEALSVPVVPRPDKLARDVSYDAPGANRGDEVTGPYVYVRSASTPAISVVSTAQRRELYQVRTSGAVTALAARGPTKRPDANTNSVLYFATQEAGRSKLYKVIIPSNPEQAVATKPQPVELPIGSTLDPVGAPLPAEGYGPVTALLVLPGLRVAPDPDVDEVVMATRKFQGVSADKTKPQREAATVTLQVAGASAVAVRSLAFSVPVANTDLNNPALRAKVAVRSLLTHPRFAGSQGQPSIREAGTRIFGLIDEESCVDQGLERCGGILAVEAADGSISRSKIDAVTTVQDGKTVVVTPALDLPMLPLSFDTSLPTGFTVAVGAAIAFNEGTIETRQTPPLLGVLAHASGSYMFFDAERLIHYDRNAARASVTDPPTVLTASNSVIQTGPVVTQNPVVVETAEGFAENENLSIVFAGPITAAAFTLRAGSERLVVPASLKGQIFPRDTGIGEGGDIVDYYASSAATEACAQRTITAVEDLPGDSQNIVLRVEGDPEGCPEATVFRLRALGFGPPGSPGGLRPFTIYSDVSGYLGRVGPTSPFEITALPRFYSSGFVPAPRLRISLKSTPVPTTNRGDKYVYGVAAQFDPFSFVIATEVPGLERFFIPGPMVYSPGTLVEELGEPELKGENRIYVAYPTADGVLQILLEGMNNNAREAQTVVPFK